MKVVSIDDNLVGFYFFDFICHKNRIPLVYFDSFDKCLSNIDEIEKDAFFFIDSRLGEDIFGEDLSEKLFEMGYKNLYILSGDIEEIDKEKMKQKYPWVLDFFNKMVDRDKVYTILKITD